jgi:diguanylate cyclase (GGDEF)-like protein
MLTDCQAWNLAALGGAALAALFFGWASYVNRKRYLASTHEIQRLAFHDVLTDLPNRLLFVDRASIAFAHAKRDGSLVAVMFIDLDRFKNVNDSFGHGAGDDVLRVVAQRLRDHLREGDTVARMGGDEFTLLVPYVKSAEDITKIASKLVDVFHTPHVVGGREIVVTASIGISIFPADGIDAEILLKNSDAAMYRAKERGGDSFELYTPALNTQALERLELEARLRRAISHRQFTLYYQPRVDIATNRVVAFEALLRWNDPERGLLMPRDFIHAAEVSGLIVPIGQWALQTACQQARRWHDEGCHLLVVSVNLSARQFHRHDLTKTIREALRTAALEPQFLELEVDESCVMNNAEASMLILRDLKTLGVRVLIAGFGAGYSSLSYLRRFPIDGLKLSRSFLTEAGRDNRPLATAALGMAKALRLKVVGEGVETQETADFLKAQSCDDIQGFLVSAALPPQECGRFMRFDEPPDPSDYGTIRQH